MPTQEAEKKVRQAGSMRHWWPKLESCSVKTPETEVIEVRDWEAATEFYEGIPSINVDRVIDAVDEVDGPPAFIRTDQASDKHRMGSASRLPTSARETVEDHVREVLSHNEMAGMTGLPWRDVVVREWLDLDHTITAFEQTPIAKELRVFIHEGDVHDYAFYWPNDALHDYRATHEPELPDDWEDLLNADREDTLNRFESEVKPLALTVAEEFDGYWSVDFALTTDDDWYAIDMAPGIASHHPADTKKPELEGLAL